MQEEYAFLQQLDVSWKGEQSVEVDVVFASPDIVFHYGG